MAEKKRWKSTGKTRVKKSRLDKVKEDTRSIKEGERRRGPNGKMNVYHNGRWYAAEKVKAKSGYGEKSNTSATVSSAKKSPASSRAKDLGLGGSASTYNRPGQKPAQEKVVNVKPKKRADSPSASEKGRRDPWGLRTEVVTPKSGKNIPIGRVVMRGNPPKKYVWNGKRYERYTGPRKPSKG